MRASPGAQVCLRLSRAHAGAGEILLALFVSCRRCMPHACGHAHALCTPRARAGTLARARSHALCGTRRASGTRKPDEGNVHRARAVQARRRSQRILLSFRKPRPEQGDSSPKEVAWGGRVARSLATCLASRLSCWLPAIALAVLDTGFHPGSEQCFMTTLSPPSRPTEKLYAANHLDQTLDPDDDVYSVLATGEGLSAGHWASVSCGSSH